MRSRCHLLPIGWGVTSDEPPVPFAERRYVASFVGSIPPRSSLKGVRALTGTPKRYCRAAAVSALHKITRSLGEDRVRTSLTRDFQESLEQGGDSYFEVLANTQVCVAPRGTAHETFRVYEALKLGCVVIADRLPRRPFYENSPIIEVSDWRDLPNLLEDLLHDPERCANCTARARDTGTRSLERVLTLRLARALELPARDRLAAAGDHHSGQSPTPIPPGGEDRCALTARSPHEQARQPQGQRWDERHQQQDHEHRRQERQDLDREALHADLETAQEMNIVWPTAASRRRA